MLKYTLPLLPHLSKWRWEEGNELKLAEHTLSTLLPWRCQAAVSKSSPSAVAAQMLLSGGASLSLQPSSPWGDSTHRSGKSQRLVQTPKGQGTPGVMGRCGRACSQWEMVCTPASFIGTPSWIRSSPVGSMSAWCWSEMGSSNSRKEK